MSRLHYLTLPGTEGWDRTIQSVSAQVSPFHRYLKVAIDAVRRSRPSLAWRVASAAEDKAFRTRAEERKRREERRAKNPSRRRDRSDRPTRDGVWVVLEAPPWRPEEADDTFERFLEAREVYDVATDRPARTQAIAVFDKDFEGRALLLEHVPTPVEAVREVPASAAAPSGALLWLNPNTWPLECQQRALRALENEPSPRVAPLVRLFIPRGAWRDVAPASIEEREWAFLRPDVSGGRLRDGTDEQRRFVSIALATPDFAILEGPPGSGKSTAIGELIVQTIRRGGRVLLCASTHVAVDSVLERLLAWQDSSVEKPILPVRIGDEERVSSDAIVPWTYRRLLGTWRGEILDFLERPEGGAPAGEPARRLLLDALTHDDAEHALPRLLLESANLVCGTTIGILQHPAIKAARREPFKPFDLMILDEASKTTLAEFLVPALYAARWVIVGDIKQLSPYVEEQHLTDNLSPLVDETLARAAACSFLASLSSRAKVTSLVATHSPKEGALLREEALARGVSFVDADEARSTEGAVLPLLYADLVCGSPAALAVLEDRIPGELEALLGPLPPMERWRAQRRALGTRDEDVEWASEVAWRLVRSYELRQSPLDRRRLDDELAALIPRAHSDAEGKRLLGLLGDIRRVALPSILELLQRGFERLEGWRDDVPLSAGLPPEVLAQRLVSLRFQHRMHPEISAFPRERFYRISPEQTLLQDASNLAEQRAWTWNRYARRALWVDIAPDRRRSERGRKNENRAEAEHVVEAILAFKQWALAGNVRRDAQGRIRPWEVAALTFYRGQETLLRELLQRRTGQHGNARNFYFGDGDLRGAVHVTLCTVDRFQGHEADLVLLSFVQSGRVGFLNSPNRLNVALTRARYQIVFVGHRTWFASERCRSELLRDLAQSAHYGRELGWEASR